MLVLFIWLRIYQQWGAEVKIKRIIANMEARRLDSFRYCFVSPSSVGDNAQQSNPLLLYTYIHFF